MKPVIDHHQAERLGPVDRQQQGMRAAEESGLFGIADLADHFHARAVHHRLDDGVEILLVDAIHLGGDLQRNAGAPRDGDGAVGPFLGRDAAQERQIARPHGLRRQQVLRQAVIDGAHEVGVRQRPALRVGDGNHRRLRQVVHRGDFRQVEAAVQRGDRRRAGARQQREHPVVQMAVQHVEIMGGAADAFHLGHVRRDRIAQAAVEAQTGGPDAFQTGRGRRIAAGEQRDFVAHVHERLRQEGDDPFGAAVEPRRDGFSQRRDLGDTHGLLHLSRFQAAPGNRPMA
jgi:hypothetical protein